MDDLFTTDWSVLGLVQEQAIETPCQHTKSQNKSRLAGATYTWAWSDQDKQEIVNRQTLKYQDPEYKAQWLDSVRKKAQQRMADPEWCEHWNTQMMKARTLEWRAKVGGKGGTRGPEQRAKIRAALLARNPEIYRRIAQTKFGHQVCVCPAGEFQTWGEAERAMGIPGGKRRKLQQQHPELYYVKREAAK